jgi:hypothetical protein
MKQAEVSMAKTYSILQSCKLSIFALISIVVRNLMPKRDHVALYEGMNALFSTLFNFDSVGIMFYD